MQKTVLAIIQKNNKILVIKRKKDDGILWSFPGGKVEPEEKDENAVIREVLEETGIICKPIKLLGERIHPTTEVMVAYWLCDFEKGEATINSPLEIDEIAWLEKEEVIEKLGSTLFVPVREYLNN